MSCGWIIYLTYYNSRNIGLVLTLIINRLYKNGYIHIGELVLILFLFVHFSWLIFLFLPFIYLFVLQVHFHSLCCPARSCSEMSISSMKICLSGTHTQYNPLSFFISFLFMLHWHSSYYCCLCVDHYHIVYVLYLIFIYSIVNLFFRIQDGLLIFRWWQMYNPKQKQHGQFKRITNNTQKLFHLFMFNHNINPTIYSKLYLFFIVALWLGWSVLILI